MRRRGDTAGARAVLIADAEQMHADYGHLAGSCFLEHAARLRTGVAVQVHGWEITDAVPGLDPTAEYLLGSDDSLTEVQ